MKFIFTLFIAAALLSGCATFKGDIPIDTEKQEAIYISPMNMDGIQDEAVFQFSIPELKKLKIAGFEIAILSESGNEVYSIKEEHVKVEGIKGFFTKKKTAAMPEELRWNGKDSSGKWVQDGEYFLNARAWDYSDNRGEIRPFKIIVDNTPPSAGITIPYTVFSPNNDGSQDTLNIEHYDFTIEDSWKGQITGERGETVISYNWSGTPENIRWNSIMDNGNPASEGKYSYRLSSTDRAGNSFSKTVDNIILNRSAYAVSLMVSDFWFSPNNDRIKDTVTFTFSAEKSDEISSIALSVLDEEGRERYSFPEQELIKGSAVYDGRGSNIRRLSEGFYYGRLTALYRNGYIAEALSQQFELDITPPAASVRREYALFSPDGDGRKDTVTIFQSSGTEGEWTGTIRDSSGTAVRFYNWKQKAETFAWDGTDSRGDIVPDGIYSYSLLSTDNAGNRFSFSIPQLIVDTVPTPVKTAARKPFFSPNSNGIDDTIDFTLTPAVKEGITGWNFSILDSSETEVYRLDGTSQTAVPEAVTWDGLNSDGAIIEGAYYGRLEVEYEKGNLPSAMTEYPVLLDLTGPEITASISPLPFSPDEDDTNDVLSISVNTSDASGVKSWSARIMDPAGNLFLNLPASRFSNGIFKWNGKSASGELVQSASDYKLIINAEDTVGNNSDFTQIIPIDILVIKDGDRLRISISSIYFKPYTADFTDVNHELREKNLATINRLSEILKKYPGYRIQVEGHGVRVFWDRAEDKWLAEETEALYPLTNLRAESIRNALVQRGIVRSRMTTSGKGGYEPVVPHSDLANRWKNRRVEFYLKKE